MSISLASVSLLAMQRRPEHPGIAGAAALDEAPHIVAMPCKGARWPHDREIIDGHCICLQLTLISVSYISFIEIFPLHLRNCFDRRQSPATSHGDA
jgi:hypothetical protein